MVIWAVLMAAGFMACSSFKDERVEAYCDLNVEYAILKSSDKDEFQVNLTIGRGKNLVSVCRMNGRRANELIIRQTASSLSEARTLIRQSLERYALICHDPAAHHTVGKATKSDE